MAKKALLVVIVTGIVGFIFGAALVSFIPGNIRTNREAAGSGGKDAGVDPRYGVLAYDFRVEDSDFSADFRKEVESLPLMKERRKGDQSDRTFFLNLKKRMELKSRPWLYVNKLVIGVPDVGEDTFKSGFFTDFSDRMLHLVLPRLPHNGWCLRQVVPNTSGSGTVSTDYLIIVERCGIDEKRR